MIHRLALACLLLLNVPMPARGDGEPPVDNATITSDAVAKLDEVTSRFAGYLHSLETFAVDVTTEWTYRSDRESSGGGLSKLTVAGDRFRLSVRSTQDAKEFVCVGDGKTITRSLVTDTGVVYSQAPGAMGDLLADRFTSSVLHGSGIEILLDSDLQGTVMVSMSEVQDLGPGDLDGVATDHFSGLWEGDSKIQMWFASGNSPTLVKSRLVIDSKTAQGDSTITTTNTFNWGKADNIRNDSFVWSPPAGARQVADLYAYLLQGSARELIGKPAPHVVLKGLNGESWKPLQDEDRQATILYFWTTWAAAPIESLAAVDTFVEEYEAKGVAIYAINVQEEEEIVRQYVTAGKFPGRVALDREGRIAQEFGVRSVPTALLIDAKGVVQEVFVGESLEVRRLVKDHIDALIKGELVPSQPTP